MIILRIEDFEKIKLSNSIKIDGLDFSIIKGKNFRNVLPVLENLGYEVVFKGNGFAE